MTTPAQPPSTGARRSRPNRPQAVLTVRHREWISGHTVRIVAGGPGMSAFNSNDFTDKYAKLIFVDPESGLTPPYDLAALREQLPPAQQPVSRTYTVRRVELENHQLSLDFVVHGDTGIAAPWAARAEIGDQLALSGAGGAYRPDPEMDWHLFLGDEAALPAICAALDALPRDARGVAYLETHDEQEVLDADPPAGVDVVWLQRPDPGTTPRLLADAVAATTWRPGRVGIFAHGERESMKSVRAELKTRTGDGDQLSLSGYWAYGRREDEFQAEKRLPIGQLDS
jgi:NADPH-dependent ferric siderophore reductase